MCGHTDSATQTAPSLSHQATMSWPSHCRCISLLFARERRLMTKYQPSGNGKREPGTPSVLQLLFTSRRILAPGYGDALVSAGCVRPKGATVRVPEAPRSRPRHIE